MNIIMGSVREVIVESQKTSLRSFRELGRFPDANSGCVCTVVITRYIVVS